MAINPDNITTIRVDQLATAVLNVGNEFPHSQGSDLKKATIQDLVDIVSTAVGAGSGVGFFPISVTDGQQLPSVPADPSFFLCGPGTYLNVNGYPNVVCTEELNAVMSVSDHWQLSVGIPIKADLPSIGISQSVNNGTIDKAPSENAVYDFVYNFVNSQLIKASLGYFDYADLATQTTPITVAPNTQTLLTNDTLGADTDISQPPFAVNRVYEGSTANEFDFSQLSIGDTVDIRFHFKVTTSANNQQYHIDLKAGIGSATEIENRIFASYVKTAGVDEQTFVTTFYIGSNDIKDNPAQVFIQSTQSCTVEVVGWFVRVFRKSVNIVELSDTIPLSDVLVNGNTTNGTNISISNGDAVILDNGANLKKGTTDAGLGGLKGIALRCAVDYELKWEAGRLYVMGGDGFTIREVSHNFTTTPTVNDDSTKGFEIGSRWILDNGDVYVCEDDNEESAIWNLQSSSVPDATTTVKGIIKLAGDLGGTASLPTVPDLANKANDSAVVHNTGDETIAGAKTFSSLLTMPSTGVTRILQVETSGQISGLDTGTFPSPNELINVKGVTSPIQTQLNLKQYTLLSVVGNFSMADATTYYFSPLGGTGGGLFTSATNLDFSSASANTLNRIYLHVVNGGGAAGTSENVSLYLRNITASTSSLIGTFQTNASTFLKFDFTSINLNIPANNLWCIEVRTPTWATNPTATAFRITSFLTQ